MNSFAIPGLVQKRAELAGEMEATQHRLHQMICELEHLDATILLFDPDYKLEAIRPKSFRPPENWSRRGEMSRIILNTLRQAAEPLTTRDVAIQLMRERALDVGDVKLLRLMTKRCGDRRWAQRL